MTAAGLLAEFWRWLTRPFRRKPPKHPPIIPDPPARYPRRIVPLAGPPLDTRK